jgi:hypothetical protein
MNPVRIASAVSTILHSPATSYWLKDALAKALNRDCVDACHDAELLAEVLRARVDMFQSREVSA